jgi:hypothetical protein
MASKRTPQTAAKREREQRVRERRKLKLEWKHRASAERAGASAPPSDP